MTGKNSAYKLNKDGSFEDRDFAFDEESALQKMAKFRGHPMVGFTEEFVILATPDTMFRIRREALTLEAMP